MENKLPFTKGQRNAIYKEAYKNIEKKNNDCICWAISTQKSVEKLAIHVWSITHFVCETFPEVSMICPTNEPVFGQFWFVLTPTGRKQRLTALALMIAMTEPSKS